MTGILWRAELETRWGWASLDWIGPFHWAFPVAAGLYLLWMFRELRELSERKRQLVLGVTAVLGAMAYFGGSTAMSWAYSRWIGLLPQFQCISHISSPLVVYAVLGAIYFTMVAKATSPTAVGTAAGVICYALAFPVALFLLWVTDHRGGADPIHAIKSGFVFPLITLALGLPITMRTRTANQGLADTARKIAVPQL